MEIKSILIVGVGGQGTLLTSRVLGSVLNGQGYDVKMSEVHGMAQRGGSVVTHVRYGDKVYSPIIDIGNADILLAFENMEALRWQHYLKDDGMLIVNNQQIDPMPVITGSAEYPDDVIDKIKAQKKNTIVVDAYDIASGLGNIRVVNTVLLGVLAKNLPLDVKLWEKAISETVPTKTVDINLAAFRQGYDL